MDSVNNCGIKVALKPFRTWEIDPSHLNLQHLALTTTPHWLSQT